MTEIPGTEVLSVLDEAWSRLSGGGRLDAITKAAPILRDKIASSGMVLAVRTFDIATFPYPTKYAFGGACSVPIPYIWMSNRALFIEYVDKNGTKRRLLANPTDQEGSREAPYFADLMKKLPRSLEWAVSRQHPPVQEQLRTAGIDPASIDYITFDHLHVQKIGPMLGPNGFYPKAKLLVTKAEREIAENLHPLQQYWYVAGGLVGVRESDIATFDRDLLLGSGLALVRTPGHTDGNHTIAVSLPGGLMTVSENGICAECYRPRASEIPGLRAFAEKTGAEVILNANTRERTLDQYTSMRLEALLAAAEQEHGWPRHFSSSELDAHPLAPRVRPTFAWRRVDHGAIALESARAHAA
jgi:hypothetical protein